MKRATQNSAKTPKRKGKPRGKPFAKGESGNPGGRPRLPPDVKEALDIMRGPLTLKAVLTLERNMDSADGMVSNVAAREWLRKTLPDEALKIQVSTPEGESLKTEATVKVEHDDSPRRLARVVEVLRSAGALPAGVGEAAAGDAPDTEDERVDPSSTD